MSGMKISKASAFFLNVPCEEMAGALGKVAFYHSPHPTSASEPLHTLSLLYGPVHSLLGLTGMNRSSGSRLNLPGSHPPLPLGSCVMEGILASLWLIFNMSLRVGAPPWHCGPLGEALLQRSVTMSFSDAFDSGVNVRSVSSGVGGAASLRAGHLD